MPEPPGPSRKKPRLHWGYLLAAIALAALLFVVSLAAFPEWTRDNSGVFVLLALVVAGAFELVANVRAVVEPPAGTAQLGPVASTINNRSGGINVEKGSVIASGNVAGRDNIMGDSVQGDKITYEAPAVPVATSLHQLPAPPGDFTGRVEELDDLLANVANKGATISGLRGMGGVGKTALALKLAERLLDRYPDAQFYLDLKGASKQPLTMKEALAHVIRAYYPTAQLPDDEGQLRGLYQTVLHDQCALLLMDNAADAWQVEPLIPSEKKCILIVTSRRHFVLPGLYTKDLDTLPPADACNLLLKIAPRIEAHAGALAQLCGCLPLALRLAGSALAERVTLTPEDYLARLADAKERLQLIEASLSLSYDLLDESLQRAWCALAVFPDTFDLAAVAVVWGVEINQAQDQLDALVRYSLVDWDQVAARARLHDLARLFAERHLSDAEQMASRRRHSACYARVLRQANDLYMQGHENVPRGLALFDLEWSSIQTGQMWSVEHAEADDEAAGLCSDYPDVGRHILHLRQHPRECIHWRGTALIAAWRLERRDAVSRHLGNLGVAYAALGEFRRAIEYHEQCLAIARELGDRRGEGAVLGNLGNAYADLGETRLAIKYHEQALVITRELGDRHGEGQALGNLGNAYADLGETRRAIELYEQHLAIARELGDRQGEGAVLGNLGVAYAALSEIRRAIKYHEQALVITRELGDRHGEGQALGNLGNAYAALGETRLAIKHHEQTLVIAREIGNRRSEGNALGNLGVAYAALGETRHAIELYEQDLAIARELGNRSGEGAVLGNLGVAYADLGETRRAIELYQQRLAIARELGDRRGEGNALGNLGVAFAALGEFRRAIELYEQDLAIAREIGDRRGEGNSLGNLGVAYAALGETRHAIELYEQRLAIAREIGDRHGEGSALGNLGNAYYSLGETRRAIELYQQRLAIARELGDRRGEGAVLGNLGNAYAALGEIRRAIELYEQDLVIARAIGDRHGEGAVLGNLGNAYAALGEFRRAIELYEQDLAIAREIGDRQGEGTALGNLGGAYAALGESRRAIALYERRLVIAREIGDRRGEGNALGNLGLAYRNLGETRRAIELYEQALVIAREIGYWHGEANTSWNLGLIYEKEGNLAAAVAAMQIRVDFERGIGHPDAKKDAARVEEIRARLQSG